MPGEREEGTTSTTVVDSDDFSAAFGEATGGEEKKIDTETVKPTTEEVVVTSEKPVIEDKGKETVKTPEEIAAALIASERETFKKELDELKGKLQELQSASPKETKETKETKEEDKTRKASVLSDTIDFNDLSDLAEEIKKEISEYDENFDEISKYEGVKRTKALNKLKDYVDAMIGRVVEIVQPLAETMAETKKATHFDQVAGSLKVEICKSGLKNNRTIFRQGLKRFTKVERRHRLLIFMLATKRIVVLQ